MGDSTERHLASLQLADVPEHLCVAQSNAELEGAPRSGAMAAEFQAAA